MNCEQALDAISAELDGTLDAVQQRALEAHLQNCPACRAVRQMLRDTETVLPETELEPPAALHDAVMHEVRADAVRSAAAGFRSPSSAQPPR